MGDYYVVFRKTAALGGHQGVMTITPFQNEDQFNEWYTPEMEKFNEVVEKGVTLKEAQALADQTPIECLVSSAFEEARQPDGKINQVILEMGLASIGFRLSEDQVEEAKRLVMLKGMPEVLKGNIEKI